jgi:hypothetical protein
VRSWALRLANLLALVTLCSFLFSPSAKAAACSPATATYNGYTYVAFLTVGNCQWSVPNGLTYIDYLVVGGGGSGAARHAGGSGAGGMISGSDASLANITSLNITVGAGGSAVTPSSQNWADGNSGNNSILAQYAGTGTFNTVTATGGGGAGASDQPGNGGSGGGGYAYYGTGISGQGNNGGTGGYFGGYYTGSGGGGAGAVGGSANTSTGAPGNGGAGKQWI